MREIKFRAWDLQKRVMYQPGNPYGDMLIASRIAESIVGDRLFDDFEIEIMQFTGLLDKNGKEIYEGDIVRGCWDESLRPQVVIYQAPSFVMKTNKRNKTWSEFILAPTEPQSQIIIGNIYENPELLEVK